MTSTTKKLITSFWILFVITAVIVVILYTSGSDVIRSGQQTLVDYCPSGHPCQGRSIQTMLVFADGTRQQTTETGYGGKLVPQVCDDNSPGIGQDSGDPCQDIDLSPVVGEFTGSSSAAKGIATSSFMSLGINAYNQSLGQAFFIYYVPLPNPTGKEIYVYQEPHVIVSYDFDRHTARYVGQIDTVFLEPRELYVSPRGAYALIVSDSPGSFWSGQDKDVLEWVSTMDLQTGATSHVLALPRTQEFRFVSWIDDRHFLYEIGQGYDKGTAILKIDTIPK